MLVCEIIAWKSWCSLWCYAVIRFVLASAWHTGWKELGENFFQYRLWDFKINANPIWQCKATFLHSACIAFHLTWNITLIISSHHSAFFSPADASCQTDLRGTDTDTMRSCSPQADWERKGFATADVHGGIPGTTGWHFILGFHRFSCCALYSAFQKIMFHIAHSM